MASQYLLMELFRLWNPKPDMLSHEFKSDTEHVVRFEWETGHIKEYPYTEDSYRLIWDRFNQYWNCLLERRRLDGNGCRN